jgi:predicted nuclease of restriction endonuclease-like RecB superfamily
LELARLLIETYEQHVGKPYGNLLSELEGYEEMNYRFIRGLSQLLGRRAVIETDAAVDPSLARETVFEACSGMALSSAEKEEAFKKAAQVLSVPVQELEKSLWADLEENQVIKSFFPLSPAELLKQYNLSLTQTLLFRAVDLDIWIKGDFQKILWKIVRSGLMYSLEDTGELEDKIKTEEPGKKGEKNPQGNEIAKSKAKNSKEKGRTEEKSYQGARTSEKSASVHLHLDGPGSLFRMSERYGNSFAKVFPILLRSKGWKLKAKILHKTYQGKRILEFTLDASEKAFSPPLDAINYPDDYPETSSESKLREEEAGYEIENNRNNRNSRGISASSFKNRNQGITDLDLDLDESSEENLQEETYDSSIEKMFGNLSLGSWKIRREPTILKAGKYAFVPDFALQRGNIKVYLEIIGFWTPEYLQKKVEKLKEVKEPLILLINKKLKCSEKDFPAQDVIFFDKKIPANEVMRILRKYEENKCREDGLLLQESEIPLSGELISLEKIAADKGVLIEALKEAVIDRLTKMDNSYNSEENETFKEHRSSTRPVESEDYVLLENYVVHRSLLEKIDSNLKKPGALELYSDAVKIFESFGLDRSLYYPVLEYLGYKVVWTGLSEENARIKK